MRAAFIFSALLSLAVAAVAGEPIWKFHPGQTFTYECETEFHYCAGSLPDTIAMPVVNNKPANQGGGTKANPNGPSRGAEANKGDTSQQSSGASANGTDTSQKSTGASANPYDTSSRNPGASSNPYDTSSKSTGASSNGTDTGGKPTDTKSGGNSSPDAKTPDGGAPPTPTESGGNSSSGGHRSGGKSDPQKELIVLTGTVLAVGDDGSARVEFVVDAVRVETRFEDTGEHALWDSRKSPTTDVAGLKRYEAILHYKFQAIVNADGSIREIIGGAWPKPAPGAKDGDARAERAANATHNPTPIATWLSLIFSTGPESKAEWQRTLKLPKEELFDVKADGRELAAGLPNCARSKMKSNEKEHAVDRKKLDENQDLQEIAFKMIGLTQKRGLSWFSMEAGCLGKCEMEGASEVTVQGMGLHTEFSWKVNLTARGAKEFQPGAPDVESGK